MADNFEVKMFGLAELEKWLQRLPEYIKRGGLINRALFGAAKIIEKQAKQNAPVYEPAQSEDTYIISARGNVRKTNRNLRGIKGPVRGALRSGIVAQFGRSQPLTAVVRVRNKNYIFGPGGKAVIGRANANYWWLLEFGTSRIPAKKFMRNAFESKKQEAANQIKRGLEYEIAKANSDPEAYFKTQSKRTWRDAL